MSHKEDDQLMPLSDAAKMFASKPCHQTLCRWAKRGIRGARLRIEVAGCRFFTRPSWVEEFKTACRKLVGDGVGE